MHGMLACARQATRHLATGSSTAVGCLRPMKQLLLVLRTGKHGHVVLRRLTLL